MLIAVTALMLVFAPRTAASDTVRKACLMSERGSQQTRLCHCLQTAANGTLSAKDQRKVSKFFADPEEAERTRRSDTRRNEVFWDRYEVFGETARKICRR